MIPRDLDLFATLSEVYATERDRESFLEASLRAPCIFTPTTSHKLTPYLSFRLSRNNDSARFGGMLEGTMTPPASSQDTNHRHGTNVIPP